MKAMPLHHQMILRKNDTFFNKPLFDSADPDKVFRSNFNLSVV